MKRDLLASSLTTRRRKKVPGEATSHFCLGEECPGWPGGIRGKEREALPEKLKKGGESGLLIVLFARKHLPRDLGYWRRTGSKSRE